MCVHVCSCAFACILLSLCVCLRPTLLLPPHPHFSKSCIADSLQAGWPATRFLFYFLNYENTQAQGATATEATPSGCIETKSAFSRWEQGAPFHLCISLRVRFSSFPLDLAVERSTAKSKNQRAGGTSWSSCVFSLFFKSEWPLGTPEHLLNFMQVLFVSLNGNRLSDSF